MEPRTGLFILCLLCVARTSEMHPAEITDSEEGSLTHKNLSGIPVREINETDKQSTDKLREKRALGLLLSGLAQIFGYTVTPIQIASLTNPNITRPAAMSNSTMTGNAMKQQTASSRPASMNTTVSRRQETIRFTGVLNFGNNSDIIGHLQRYEQIFHGNNTSTSAMTTSKPAPTPASNTSIDPRMNSQTKAPLLAPFFVKIPLPLAPNLPPATMPIANFKVSYPLPVFSVMSGSNENAETPVRKEQETVYRKNEDTERYTVHDKDIYDEKDVSKPASKYNHELYIDDPNYNQQQDDRYDEVQDKQQEHVERLKEQEEQRNRDKDTYYKEDEVNERYRNREEEIDNRNREYAPKHEPKEENRPEYDDEADENSAERYEEHANQANGSGESKQPTEQENEQDKTEGYSNYNSNDNPNDNPNKQFDGYKYPDNFEKYIQVDYNRELPIGDYFHDGNPEVIRDSYGQVLDNKKSEDDRLSGYFSMFKQPYTSVYDSQEVRNPEDSSKENEKQTSAAHSYEEHLDKLQKLREEYALPENKYEEYDINNESEADRNDRESERIQNRTSARSRKPETNRLHSTKDSRAKTPTDNEKNRNEVSRDDVARSEDANSQEEIDFVRYTPLIVPVRYIDASDKVEQATTQQRSNMESDKSPHNQFPEDNADSKVTLTVAKDNLALPIGLPARPKQLHEDERKELQIWPPPFDYVYDNTEPVNVVVPPNPHNYPPNYQHVVKNVAANDANNDNASEPPSGYVVVVGNPMHPYRYPYNVYYFPNEAVDQNSHLNVEGAHSQDQVYIPQQSMNQQFVQTNPNVTEYNLNETTKDFRDYYYQPQETPINHLDRYRYIFEERTSEESPNVDIKSQITGTENWSSRVHRPRDETIKRSSPMQLQNVGSLNQQNVQNKSPERSRYSQPPRRRRKNSRPEEQRKDDGKMNAPSRQSIRRSRPFANAQSTPDSFSFRKVDNNFEGESSNMSRITRGNSKIAKKSSALGAPEPVAYHRNESPAKHIDEPERNVEKANVREYRNKVTTLRMSEQSRLRPNGSPHYVNFMRDI